MTLDRLDPPSGLGKRVEPPTAQKPDPAAPYRSFEQQTDREPTPAMPDWAKVLGGGLAPGVPFTVLV